MWRVQIHAKVAQLVEHSTENAGVVGSIPSLGTTSVKQGEKRSQGQLLSPPVPRFFAKCQDSEQAVNSMRHRENGTMLREYSI